MKINKNKKQNKTKKQDIGRSVGDTINNIYLDVRGSPLFR